jgi:transcriptional regulator with XRE-family HTH domain
MNPKKFHKVIENSHVGVREHIELSMAILDRIHDLLDEKFQGKQKLLAEKMNKSEAEVSKWFSGVQNFTTKTIVKLEIAFGEPILAVVTSSLKDSTYELVKTSHSITEKYLKVDDSGQLNEDLVFSAIRSNGSHKKPHKNLPV